MGGGQCDFSVGPSPFGLDFGTLDLGLTIRNLGGKMSESETAV